MYLTKLASIQMVVWNILEKYNEDPVPVFKQVHLNPSLMHKPGARHSLRKIAELWTETGRRIKDPCFGLTAATCWHPSYFGTLGYAMLVSKSLRVTLERFIRFHRVISEANYGDLHEDHSTDSLIFTLKYKDEAHYSRGREDAALAWLLSLLRVNFQNNLTPVSVHLTHPKPECSGKYYEFFKSPVHFNSSFCRLSLPLEVVDRILPGSNEEFANFGEQAIKTYLLSMDEADEITQIKKIIIDNLPSGNITVEQVAGEFGVNTRTLQRMLQKKGTTFLSLLNETRMEIGKKYIQDKYMDLTEIAFLLGFAELSTFSRSFKRWTGKSPIQYRQAA